MSKLVYTIIIFVIVLVGVIFAILNAELVQLNYYFGSKQLPLSLAIILSMLLGALLGVLVSMQHILKNKRELTRLKKAAELAEKEIANLRAIPIKNQH